MRHHCFCNAQISKHVYFGCFVDFRHKAPQPHRCGALCMLTIFPQSLLSPISCFSLLSRISKSPSFFPAKIPSQFFNSTRAYVTGISTFLLSQPSQYRTKATSKTAISSVSSFLPKSAFFLPFQHSNTALSRTSFLIPS